MKKIKYITLSVLVFILLGVSIFLWTGKLMNEGTEPIANGQNEYAILLGARVKENGEPSLSLKYRLEEAVNYLQKYPHVQVIVSGGQGADEPISEASFMKQYLIDKGIDQNRITMEDQSTSTYENILYSKKLLPDDVKEITLISNDFHLKRAQLLAKKQGFTTDVVAAPTPKSVETMMRLRERVALLKAMILGN